MASLGEYPCIVRLTPLRGRDGRGEKGRGNEVQKIKKGRVGAGYKVEEEKWRKESRGNRAQEIKWRRGGRGETTPLECGILGGISDSDESSRRR